MVDAGRITSAGINALDVVMPYVGPVLNVLGLEDGTPHVSLPGYAGGSPMVPMPGYAGGTDTVPAMLTPGEAVIPREAAQNPMNKPAIDAMIHEGRTGIPAQDQMVSPQPAPTTKEQREDAKFVQDLSLSKKSWVAEEKRKQETHEQDMHLKLLIAAMKNGGGGYA